MHRHKNKENDFSSNDQNISDDYFTTKEKMSDIDFNSEDIYSSKYKKKRKNEMKKKDFNFKKNGYSKYEKKDEEKYYDVKDKNQSDEHISTFHHSKNTDKNYFSFSDNDKNNKKYMSQNKKKGKKKTYIEKQEDYGKNYKYKTRNEYDKTNNESYKNQNFNDSAHNLISNYEKCIQLNDKRKEIKMEQYRIMNYIKKNEIKEKIRNKKRKKIHSVYLMYEKTYKINKSKLNYFYIFLRLTKNIKHEYIINPNYFEGYVEIFLSLIPTDHGERPFSRCFSSWGIQRRSQNEFDECLPKISVFVTLKNMKIIFSDKQMSNLIKWLNLNFVTYSTWKAGILSQFEKPKATPNEEMCYINKWVLKLLDTHLFI